MARLLNRIVDEAALRQPGAPAIRCDGETLSYEQLARRANGLARVLVGTGLARGDRVAVWLARGPNVPVSFYGVLAAGGTLVPIDPRSPLEQVVRILRATGATRMVSEPERGEAVRRALAAVPGCALTSSASDTTPACRCRASHGRRCSKRPATGPRTCR